MVAIKSGAYIRVQVESIKWRKTEGSSAKRKLPGSKIWRKRKFGPSSYSCLKKEEIGQKRT